MQGGVMKLYKILINGKSCNGGTLKWDLPKDGNPGKWHSVRGEINICAKGLHLTKKRYMWYSWGCTCYEAEAKDIKEWEDDKCVCRSARLIKEVPHPKWWKDAEKFVEELNDIKWLQPDGKPLKKWKVFYGDDWSAARSAAWSAALYNQTHNICRGLKLESKHKKHAKAGMQVWRKGYALLTDVNGVLYVYAPEKYRPKK
jgi:hypothetical protein